MISTMKRMPWRLRAGLFGTLIASLLLLSMTFLLSGQFHRVENLPSTNIIEIAHFHEQTILTVTTRHVAKTGTNVGKLCSQTDEQADFSLSDVTHMTISVSTKCTTSCTVDQNIADDETTNTSHVTQTNCTVIPSAMMNDDEFNARYALHVDGREGRVATLHQPTSPNAERVSLPSSSSNVTRNGGTSSIYHELIARAFGSRPVLIVALYPAHAQCRGIPRIISVSLADGTCLKSGIESATKSTNVQHETIAPSVSSDHDIPLPAKPQYQDHVQLQLRQQQRKEQLPLSQSISMEGTVDKWTITVTDHPGSWNCSADMPTISRMNKLIMRNDGICPDGETRFIYLPRADM